MSVLPNQTLHVKSSRVLSFLNPVLSFLSYVLIVFIACFFAVESPHPPPAKSKRLRKRTVVQYVAIEEPAIVPTITSGTYEELREAFEAVEQEKERGEEEEPHEKTKVEEEMSFVDCISGFLFLIPFILTSVFS